MQELLLRLVDHMRWADALVADAIERGPVAVPEAVRLFAHVAAVEHLWYARIRERPAEHAVWPSLDVRAARALAAEHADLLERLVTGADGGELARTVVYRNSAGQDYSNSVGDIVTHVAMHGSHHRGQIARVLRASGHEPPYVDYIQFIRRGQAR
jgi:uncharacterized damage-inducible protein DinB